ncbi:MAG: hypothetical protein LBJ00_06960 [Planctomycetaceae bacterium]|jgi:hypothetical protein|nr:hypothetical protein [Planctomycetaceae bacterium]
MSVSVVGSEVFSDRYVGVDEVELVEESMMLNSPVVEELSTTHVGQWNNLVSQTNWEKGALIIAWRNTLLSAEMPKAAYSDEAWSRRVGNVSPQHVGRLRRVFERFGGQLGSYSGLYWSHFQAALDWDDAEMWLEGAVQNSWSVAQMRVQRWEAIGAPEELKPRSEDVFTAELDDDVNPRNDSFVADKSIDGKMREIGAADIVDGFEPPDSVIADKNESKTKKKQKKSEPKQQNSSLENEILQTGEVLANLGNNAQMLPTDLAEATELFKIAILNHKLALWQEVSVEVVIGCLNSLKALAISEEKD